MPALSISGTADHDKDSPGSLHGHQGDPRCAHHGMLTPPGPSAASVLGNDPAEYEDRRAAAPQLQLQPVPWCRGCFDANPPRYAASRIRLGELAMMSQPPPLCLPTSTQLPFDLPAGSRIDDAFTLQQQPQ